MMRVQRNQQRGVSLLWVISGLAVGVFLATFAVKVVPHYVDFLTISSALSSVLEESDAGDRDTSQIVNKLDKQLLVNNLRDFNVRDAVKVNQEKGMTVVRLDYNVTENFFDNDFSDIRLVLHFHKEFTAAGE